MIPSGQASFHIDLDVSLLGRFGRARKPRALIADVAQGLEIASGLLDRRRLVSGHFVQPALARELIEAEWQDAAARRYPKLVGYLETLESLGYRVFGVPDLRVDWQHNLFSVVNLDFYTVNVLPGLRRGEPAVHLLPYGFEPLDRAVSASIRRAGLPPNPLVSGGAVGNALAALSGGLHCVCGQL